MKIMLVILFGFFIISACDSTEPDTTQVYPLPTMKIEKIEVTNKKVDATITVWTPIPCYYYYMTEKSQNDLIYTAKIIGQYDGQPCIQMTSSFIREETIIFLSNGEKTLRFWQNDSTCVDTTITLK